MSRPRSLEPKPIVIVVFAFCGAIGIVLGGALDSFAAGFAVHLDRSLYASLWGAGLGLAIGTALCISDRFWIRVLTAPVLGFVGYVVGQGLRFVVSSGTIPEIKYLMISGGLLMGATTSLAFVVADDLLLRFKAGTSLYLISLPIYALLRLVSCVPYVVLKNEWVDLMLLDLLFVGAPFGVLQLMALGLARAIDSSIKRRREYG